MNAMLYWRGLRPGAAAIPDGEVSAGHHVRLVMPSREQDAFIERVFRPCPAIGREDRAAGRPVGRVWVEAGGVSHLAGSEGFFHAVGSLIRGRGMLANLSLRENLLLPFLYDLDPARLDRAAAEVEPVAQWLGLEHRLDARAGEGSAFVHALVSLGRCRLMRPGVIIAQEAHVGMSPERLARFRALAIETVRELDAGVLYLTSSVEEGSGIPFARTLHVAGHAGAQAPKEEDVSGVEGA